MNSLIETAKAWLAQDPDPETRAELEALLAAGNEDELTKRFGSRLEFGTAGLRGELGAGSNRMNRVLVAQAAVGLARFLIEREDKPSIVIGFDARKNSAIFARDSAELMAELGVRVWLFDSACPTPVLAFAGKRLEASAGVMVTASHNPANDNGYKVYLGGSNGGSQIVPPQDAQIAAHIKAAAAKSIAEFARSQSFERVPDEIWQDYVMTAARLVAPYPASKSGCKIVYTPMHGVGLPTAIALFEAAGMPRPDIVAEQAEPDPTFPTVVFPNPEEAGAMDLSFALAREVDADLVLANDPDADRLAVGIPDATAVAGFRRLTGDEVGLILGDWAAARAVKDSRTGSLACSIVSSSALAKVAAKYELDFKATLTGFKWISKVPELIFGYEEALGYCLDPEHTPDKDGISAAVVVAGIANELATRGSNLAEHLTQLQRKHGFFATGQISIRVDDLSEIDRMMTSLRSAPPTSIDGVAATLTDLALGSDELPPTDGLLFNLADRRRVIVRPSGTEPKLKCYLQAEADSQDVAQAALRNLDAAMRALLV